MTDRPSRPKKKQKIPKLKFFISKDHLNLWKALPYETLIQIMKDVDAVGLRSTLLLYRNSPDLQKKEIADGVVRINSVIKLFYDFEFWMDKIFRDFPRFFNITEKIIAFKDSLSLSKRWQDMIVIDETIDKMKIEEMRFFFDIHKTPYISNIANWYFAISGFYDYLKNRYIPLLSTMNFYDPVSGKKVTTERYFNPITTPSVFVKRERDEKKYDIVLANELNSGTNDLIIQNINSKLIKYSNKFEITLPSSFFKITIDKNNNIVLKNELPIDWRFSFLYLEELGESFILNTNAPYEIKLEMGQVAKPGLMFAPVTDAYSSLMWKLEKNTDFNVFVEKNANLYLPIMYQKSGDVKFIPPGLATPIHGSAIAYNLKISIATKKKNIYRNLSYAKVSATLPFNAPKNNGHFFEKHFWDNDIDNIIKDTKIGKERIITDDDFMLFNIGRYTNVRKNPSGKYYMWNQNPYSTVVWSNFTKKKNVQWKWDQKLKKFIHAISYLPAGRLNVERGLFFKVEKKKNNMLILNSINKSNEQMLVSKELIMDNFDFTDWLGTNLSPSWKTTNLENLLKVQLILEEKSIPSKFKSKIDVTFNITLDIDALWDLIVMSETAKMINQKTNLQLTEEYKSTIISSVNPAESTVYLRDILQKNIRNPENFGEILRQSNEIYTPESIMRMMFIMGIDFFDNIDDKAVRTMIYNKNSGKEEFYPQSYFPQYFDQQLKPEGLAFASMSHIIGFHITNLFKKKINRFWFILIIFFGNFSLRNLVMKRKIVKPTEFLNLTDQYKCNNINCPKLKDAEKKHTANFLCGQCEKVIYCSEECQKQDWDIYGTHKYQCKKRGD